MNTKKSLMRKTILKDGGIYRTLRQEEEVALLGEEIERISIAKRNVYFYLKNRLRFKVPRRLSE